ncbi:MULTISPECIES: hypothetical protein [unclassified Mesorhizobium]|uniref:hypothetical protein n=1 Tax=unclassified Mesorhizobium TaxID=325217 RepID=UPI0015E2D670|nr:MULTISPECIES: hypothetical protein [unclassified Mesorhizobium]MBZ9973887.1 hypothetical protein [Mesorhizobium sp. BR-1-1-10]
MVIDKNVKRLATFVDQFYVVEKGCVAWSGNAQEVVDEEATINPSSACECL